MHLKKSELVNGEEYAFWTGSGTMSVLKDTWSAERATGQVMRVKLIDKHKLAKDTGLYEFTSEKKRVIYVQQLDMHTGDPKDKFYAVENGTKIACTWSHFNEKMAGILKRVADRDKLNRELEELGNKLVAAITERAGLPEGVIDRFSIGLVEPYDDAYGRRHSGHEYASGRIEFETIQDVCDYLEKQ